MSNIWKTRDEMPQYHPTKKRFILLDYGDGEMGLLLWSPIHIEDWELGHIPAKKWCYLDDLLTCEKELEEFTSEVDTHYSFDGFKQSKRREQALSIAIGALKEIKDHNDGWNKLKGDEEHFLGDHSRLDFEEASTALDQINKLMEGEDEV